MSFFDVRKWYSFVSLQPPPPPHAYDRRRHPSGGGSSGPGALRDNFRAPRGYVDIAPTCDSRWEWDRSLRERPRTSSRQQQLRGAFSEEALTDDASSQPATPRSYLRKAAGQRAAPASATEESPAGTDVLSSSWEAGTPGSERSRKDYIAPRVSVDDSVLYERISRVISAEDIEDVSGQKNSGAVSPLRCDAHRQTTECQDTLEQCSADRSGEEAVDVIHESLPDRRSTARTSGKWSAKLFGHSASKPVVYQTVQKGKKGALVSLNQGELSATPSCLEQHKDEAPSDDLGPPVPAKSWDVMSALRTDEQGSSRKVRDPHAIVYQQELSAFHSDDQSRQSTSTHVPPQSTEESSAKQQFPSQFEKAPRSSGKWGRKLFGLPKTKVQNESHEEEKEKHYSRDNKSYNTDNFVRPEPSNKEVLRDTGAPDSMLVGESDVALKRDEGVEIGYQAQQGENSNTVECSSHSVPAVPVRYESLEQTNPSSTRQSDSPESVSSVAHTDAHQTNEVLLLGHEHSRGLAGPEETTLSPEANLEIIDYPTSPSKSPGRKKGFFKFPSFKKKKKLSASSIEEPVPPISAVPVATEPVLPPAKFVAAECAAAEPVAEEPEKSFDEILAELRKQQEIRQAPTLIEPKSPLRGQLKKVPPPVLPKSWKTTANLNLSMEYQESSLLVKETESVGHAQLSPLASEKNGLPASVPIPSESTPLVSSSLAKESGGHGSMDENLQLPVKSYFDQEHEVTVLEAQSKDVLSSSPTAWTYSTFLRGCSEDFVDSSPRRRHNLRLLADVSVSSDALPAITEARNLNVSENARREQSPDLPGNSTTLRPVDKPQPVEHVSAPDQQEYFLYKPSGESKTTPQMKFFSLKSKKKVEVEDSYREVVAAACERYEQVTDLGHNNEDTNVSQLLTEQSQEVQVENNPTSNANEVFQEAEEPCRDKERRFSLKLSSLRKKKVDKPTKKPDSFEQPKILAALRHESKPRLPVDKGSMMDAYLRSLEMQPKSQPRNQSDDSLDLSFVS